MSTRHRLSRVALWLLECSRVDDELTGDLLEEMERGRSRAWFWREVLAASWFASWRLAPTYRRSSFTGALAGLTASWLLITVASQLLVGIGWLPHAVDWRVPHYFALLGSGFVCTAAAGWLVARLHRAHPVAALVGFSAFLMTAPLWKLPFIARLYPAVFAASIQPHLTVLILSLVFVAPVAILAGGRLDTRRAGPRTAAAG